MSEQNTGQPKVANIRLKADVEPITVSGKAYTGNGKEAMPFPTLERQKNGWCSKDPKRIVREYGDRYELIKPGGDDAALSVNKGGN